MNKPFKGLCPFDKRLEGLSVRAFMSPWVYKNSKGLQRLYKGYSFYSIDLEVYCSTDDCRLGYPSQKRVSSYSLEGLIFYVSIERIDQYVFRNECTTLLRNSLLLYAYGQILPPLDSKSLSFCVQGFILLPIGWKGLSSYLPRVYSSTPWLDRFIILHARVYSSTSRLHRFIILRTRVYSSTSLLYRFIILRTRVYSSTSRLERFIILPTKGLFFYSLVGQVYHSTCKGLELYGQGLIYLRSYCKGLVLYGQGLILLPFD